MNMANRTKAARLKANRMTAQFKANKGTSEKRKKAEAEEGKRRNAVGRRQKGGRQMGKATKIKAEWKI